MPERKGRRRRPRDRDRERRRLRGPGPVPTGETEPADTTEDDVVAALEPVRTGRPKHASDERLPSSTARATGFMIALLTAVLAVVMVYGAITDSSGVDAILRIAGGVALVGLAVFVGLLSVAPALVRDRVRRRSPRT